MKHNFPNIFVWVMHLIVIYAKAFVKQHLQTIRCLIINANLRNCIFQKIFRRVMSLVNANTQGVSLTQTLVRLCFTITFTHLDT